ncbi:eukaryotic translation initiation factor 4G [Daucus carota subsp. sativus]|uniref:eukaryotic translation initiation factor 4G n=1 Tax=Daucus carota subsp. sativus TaxID=79200 RepID=UPI0007EF54B3|nr:PREDICTED: eukaryotic translation initiation factor 4G-like [Daucus carota subsp. sativus]
MSVNQTRADKTQSGQYRATGRFSRSNSGGGGGHRNYASRGGGANPPSRSTSFKKGNDVQGVQTRVTNGSVNLDSSNNAALPANAAHSQSHGGADAQAAVKPADVSSQKSTRGVPKAPVTNAPAVISSTMAPSTPVKGGGFPLQFGSISPGLMQVPARTSSAPPNLDEQKREQARYDSLRAAPVLPIQSIPKQQVSTRKYVTADQSSAVDGHSVSKARRDVQVTAGPHTIQTQKPTLHPVTGMPMQMPFHQSQIPAQFGGLNPQLQSQSMVNSSIPVPMPIPMTMPFPMGNQGVPQQVYFQGVPPHMLPPHSVMHQVQGTKLTSQMGTQLPHLGNIGMNINPQFSQQPGDFGNARKTVKITHPDTHEELSLVKKADTSIEAGSSAARSQPSIPPPSQPIPTFPPAHPVNSNPNSYIQGSIILKGPSSLLSSSNQIAPSLQVPKLHNQVPVMPVADQCGEKNAESLLPISLSTVEKTIPIISSREGEATLVPSQIDAENITGRLLQQSKSTLIPVQSRPTIGVSDSVSAVEPKTDFLSSTSPEITEHLPSMASSTTLGTKTDASKSDDNNKKPGKKIHSLLQNQSTSGLPSSLKNEEIIKSSPSPEAGPAQDDIRESEGTAVDLRTDSTEVQGNFDMAKIDGDDSVKISAELAMLNKAQFDDSEENASGYVRSPKSILPRVSGNGDKTDSPVVDVKDEQQELKVPESVREGGADNVLASTSGAVNFLITKTSLLSLGARITHDADKNLAPDASTNNNDAVGRTEALSTVSGMLGQNFPILSVSSQSEMPCATEVANIDSDSTGLLCPSTDSRDKPMLQTNVSKNTLARGKKKRKEALQKADRAGTTTDLYMAYKGSDEKKETLTNVESSVTTSSHAREEISSGTSHKEIPNESKAEPDDWEDAADLSTPKLESLEDQNQLGEVKHHIEDESSMTRKYSRDFLLKFSEQYKDLPDGFEITSDITELLTVSMGNVPREKLQIPGRNVDRSMERSRSGRRGSGMNFDEKRSKVPGPFPSGLDMGYGNHGNNVVFQPGGNLGVLKNSRAQVPVMYSGVLSGPVQYMNQQFGMQRTNSDAERWQRTNSFQRGLIPSPRTPSQMMHKAERKYEVGKVTDEEQAKQRQLKGILNKLTPQNFERLFEQVKQVNIDNAGTLTGVISQIFDKALMEPTFCEMYANFCYYLAGELPDFIEDNEKVTFKRLLLNKCQEEFERGEREQEEANRADEEGETKQSDEEREEKRIQARRRMLGNIRLIGELYKKKMLTERIMHECIKKLLGQYQNPDEEDIEALCKLMSTIGEMIDHPKAKEHIDAYFDMMAKLSNNMKLSSRVRFMLKDSIDLRKNRWQQRRKVEGPKKIEEVHRDAANERQAQANRLARTSSMNSSSRRVQQPTDFAPRGSNGLLSPNAQFGGFRGVPQTPRGYATQDIRTDERHLFDSRIVSVPLFQRPPGNESITLGPQGGLARGMSIRGQPSMSKIPFSDMHSSDFRGTTTSNGYGSLTDRPAHGSREELFSRVSPDKLVSPATSGHMNLKDGNLTYRNREVQHPDQVLNRSRPSTPQTRSTESSSVGNIPPEKVLPKEQLRKMSMETIKEFYSAKDEKEVALCVKDLNAPSFYPSMIYLWISDSFERKDMERDLLAKLLINLAKPQDALLSQPQLVEGFESVLASLEDAVTDAPKAPEFLGGIFAKVVLENVLPLAEIGRLIYEGGEEQGQLVDSGLAAKVIGRVLEIIKIEKGDAVLKQICTGSSLSLENFRPPNSKRPSSLDQFI